MLFRPTKLERLLQPLLYVFVKASCSHFPFFFYRRALEQRTSERGGDIHCRVELLIEGVPIARDEGGRACFFAPDDGGCAVVASRNVTVCLHCVRVDGICLCHMAVNARRTRRTGRLPHCTGRGVRVLVATDVGRGSRGLGTA